MRCAHNRACASFDLNLYARVWPWLQNHSLTKCVRVCACHRWARKRVTICAHSNDEIGFFRGRNGVAKSKTAKNSCRIDIGTIKSTFSKFMLYYRTPSNIQRFQSNICACLFFTNSFASDIEHRAQCTWRAIMSSNRIVTMIHSITHSHSEQ